MGQTISRSRPPWTIAEHAGDLAQLIEAVCAAPVFLIGLSMGSLIAVSWPMTDPSSSGAPP